MTLKRIQRRLCDETCVAGCIAIEKSIEADINNLLSASRCQYTCFRDDDGITVTVDSKSMHDRFMLLYVKNHIRVAHDRIIKSTGESSQREIVFRSPPEAIGFLAQNIPMDSF